MRLRGIQDLEPFLVQEQLAALEVHLVEIRGVELGFSMVI